MKNVPFILLLQFSLQPWGAETRAASAPLPIERLAIAPGQSLKVSVPAQAQVRLTNGRAVKIEDLGQSVLITGKKAGISELRVGSKVYELHVVSQAAQSLSARFERFLKTALGLKTSWDEGKLVVEGDLLRVEDWLKLADLSNGQNYFFRARMPTPVQQDAIAHFNRLIAENHLTAPSLDLTEEARISLPPGRPGLKRDFERVFWPYGFKIETDDKLVSLEPMVEVSIVVAEVRRKTFERLGIQWPSSYSARILPKPEWTSPVDIALQSLEEKGLGKILASPKLLCRSGKEAQFLAGGEFPIKIMNFKVNDVVWKKHGVLLKIRPLVDHQGHMSIGLETEVSMIDSSQVVDGIPGLLTNRIESHFDLERPETIALSGLIKKEWGKSRTGLPGLASLPILGLLFSSEDYRENRTELVVFVTPKVVPVKGLNHHIILPEGWDASR